MRLTRHDRDEVVRRATARGLSAAEIEALTGINSRQVERRRANQTTHDLMEASA